MNKPLKEWTVNDMLEFFEKHELTPQQIIPVFGSGALTMAMMSSDKGETKMEEYYRNIAGELTLIVIQDLGHHLA